MAAPSQVSSLTTASLHRRTSSTGQGADLRPSSPGDGRRRSSVLANANVEGTMNPATASAQLPAGAPSGSRINTVTYKGASIKALIDPSLRVSDVVRQLCANSHLGVHEPPSLFTLRDDEDDELIDDGNMARKIASRRNFKLTASPIVEASEIVEKLSVRDDRVLKLAIYALQRLIREEQFVQEFLSRGGLEALKAIVMSSESGNTLAYALTSMQNLLESRDEGWENLGAAFISKVVHILTAQDRINVCRPAAAILKKLVVSGPENVNDDRGKVLGDGESMRRNDPSSAMARAATQETLKSAGKVPSTSCYGFEIIFTEITKEPLFLKTLRKRLSSPDTTLCMYSLSLINSLMKNVSPLRFNDFIQSLEELEMSGAVARLMSSSHSEELASTILDYQANIGKVAHQRLKTSVTPTDKRHVGALSYIWLQARVQELTKEDEAEIMQKYKWRRLGFESENIVREMSRTGWLGLMCCESFVQTDPGRYTDLISEQLLRPDERRFPWGKASLEVVEILSEHYGIEAGYMATTAFQPFLLSLSRLHYLATCFFAQMWNESAAAQSDFLRISSLVRSQVGAVLRDELSKTWATIEADLLKSNYRVARERQMRELENEDDYASKPSIRNLRSRIYRESYEFVRQQRIQCLLEGAWFSNPVSNAAFSASSGTSRSNKSGLAFGSNGAVVQTKPWRFYRLSPNQRYLYYCEAFEKGPVRNGLDDLPERIDLSLVTEVGTQQSAQTVPQTTEPNLTMSLLRAPDMSMADLVALNASQFSEWVDGLSMLRNEGGVISTKETADFIQTLTDIGIKIKLLDLTGEQVDIPSSMDAAPFPQSTSFFFAEL